MVSQGTGRAKNDPDAEKIASAVLSAMKPLFENHSREMSERLFGPSPTSLQSQITAIKESTIGDSPVSLRSRQTETEKKLQFMKIAWSFLCLVFGGLLTFFAIKFQTVAGWLGYAPKSLPMMIEAPRYEFYDVCCRLSSSIRAIVARVWLVGALILCVCTPKIQSALRRFF